MDIIAMINVTEKEVRGEVEEVVGLVEKQEEKVDEKEDKGGGHMDTWTHGHMDTWTHA